MKARVIAASALVMLLVSAGSAWANSPKNADRMEAEEPLRKQVRTIEVEAVETEDADGAVPVLVREREQEREMERVRDASDTPDMDRERQREMKDVTASATATLRRSAVANAVQEMLRVADRVGGIGEQVRVIAQAQNQDQERLEARLEKIEKRGRIAKFFLGANYGEINNAEKILEQNRLRIQQLNEIKSQITNEGDQQALTEQIGTLEQETSQTEETLNSARKGFSLLGWMFRLFAK